MPFDSIVYQPIGHVRSPHREPRPASEMRQTVCEIVIDPAYVVGLEGLAPGQRVLVIFHFHLIEGYRLLQHPKGDPERPERGIFALRSPSRPNPIGVTEVDLLEVRGSLLRVRGLDALDGSPVLDIKPA